MRNLALFAAIVALLAACGESAATPTDFVDIPGIGGTRVDVPRPRTADEDCTAALSPAESVTERVAALRQIGLFADRAELSDDELGADVEAAIIEAWGGPIADDDPLAELIVAEQDRNRIWWRDLEADVVAGGEVYAATIQEWAGISVGAFSPTSVEEAWASESGPIEVEFDLAGTAGAVQPEYLEDWIDPRVILEINELIASSGRQFAMFEAFDQTAFLVALTQEERAALEERGWCFD